MRKKTQKEIIHAYLRLSPASIAREVAEGTGIKQSSVSKVLVSLIAEGMVQVSGETVGRGGVTNHYEIVPGTEMARSNQDVVYDVLLDCGQATLREVSKQSGLEIRVASNAISALRKAGKVEVVGFARDSGTPAYVYRVISEAEEGSLEGVIERIVALGGGPFGLMAAQLGATA